MWGEWSPWTQCSLSCGPAPPTSSRTRARVCVPGTDNMGSQNVLCDGDSTQLDTASCEGRATSSCPDPHCPSGFYFSSKFVLGEIYLYKVIQLNRIK